MIEAEILIEAQGWDAVVDAEALALRAVAAAVAVAPSPPRAPAAMSVLLADDATVRRLNADFRGSNAATNVLSFPAAGTRGILGDIVLAFETVAREADEEGKSLADHAAHLIVHGVLHLIGHDHLDEDEAEAMEALEVAALARLGIADPYAEPAA